MGLGSNYALNNLAASGVIGFDDDFNITGNSYNQEFLSPLDRPLYDARMGYYGIKPGKNLSGTPKTDVLSFQENRERPFKFPFKGVLAGGLVGALAIGLGVKIKSLIKNTSKKVAGKKGFLKNIKEKITSIFSNNKIEDANKTPVFDIIKNKANDIGNKTKKTVEEITKKPFFDKAKNMAKNVLEKGKEVFAKIPRGVKIAGLIGAGLLGLYEIFNIITAPRNQYPRR